VGNGFATASGPGTPRTLAPTPLQPNYCFTVSLPESSSLWDSNVRTCDTNNGLLTRIACMLSPPIRAIGPHEEPWSSSDRNSPATGAWRTSPPLHPLESTRLCASTQQTYGSKPRSEVILRARRPRTFNTFGGRTARARRPMAQPNAQAKWRGNFHQASRNRPGER
jgi:hypothetical protein